MGEPWPARLARVTRTLNERKRTKGHILPGGGASNEVPVIAAELEAAAEERGLRAAMAAQCEGCRRDWPYHDGAHQEPGKGRAMMMCYAMPTRALLEGQDDG